MKPETYEDVKTERTNLELFAYMNRRKQSKELFHARTSQLPNCHSIHMTLFKRVGAAEISSYSYIPSISFDFPAVLSLLLPVLTAVNKLLQNMAVIVDWIPSVYIKALMSFQVRIWRH